MPPRRQAANQRFCGVLQQTLAAWLVYSDANVSFALKEKAAWLVYHAAQAAGAVGKAQGESLLHAMEVLHHQPLHTIQTLIFCGDSAGAHFEEPMEGLFHLNAFLESLWQLRNQGVRITVVSEGWLYGGMAMALSTVAQEIVLSESCNMGLFGSRVLAEQTVDQVPSGTDLPTGLRFIRTNLFQWLDDTLKQTLNHSRAD